MNMRSLGGLKWAFCALMLGESVYAKPLPAPVPFKKHAKSSHHAAHASAHAVHNKHAAQHSHASHAAPRKFSAHKNNAQKTAHVAAGHTGTRHAHHVAHKPVTHITSHIAHKNAKNPTSPSVTHPKITPKRVIAGGAAVAGAAALAHGLSHVVGNNGAILPTGNAQANGVQKNNAQNTAPKDAPANQAPAKIDRVERPEAMPAHSYAYLKTRKVYMRRGPGENYPIDWVYERRGMPVKLLTKYNVWREVEDENGVKGWMHQITLRGGRHFIVTGRNSADDAQTVYDMGTKDSGDNQDNAGLDSERNDQGSSQSEQAAKNQKTDKKADQNDKNRGGDPQIAFRVDDTNLPPQNAVALHADLDPHSPIRGYVTPGVVGTIVKCTAGELYCDVKVQDTQGWLLKSRMWGVDSDENVG